MKGDERKKTGRRGEDAACKWLMDNGHTILERNWRCGRLEIDIISCDRNGIHFVEVKSRRIPVQANPQDSVDAAKQRKIATAAARYLAMKSCGRPKDEECRFDVISVLFDGRQETVEYFPEAYFPIYV